MTTQHSSSQVKVQLECEGSIVEGVAAGPTAGARQLHLIGAATLRAVETHLGAQGLLLLETVPPGLTRGRLGAGYLASSERGYPQRIVACP